MVDINSSSDLRLQNNKIVVTGPMTLETVAHLQTVAQPLFISQPQLEFDLRGVSRSDSSALALLALWTRQAKTLNKKISFENLPQQLVEIAQLSGLEKILPLM